MSIEKLEGFGKSLNKAANLLLLASLIGATGIAIVASIESGMKWWQVGFIVCGLLFTWSGILSWLKITGEKQGIL